MNAPTPNLAAFGVLEPGHVWLVGAGPGDPGLMTLLGLNALQQADVVVHDALLGPEVLTWARPEAELIFAGKRGGVASSPKQVDISAQLIALAKAGKRVVRLKGGDPLVFGRGGEEALALLAADVPFRFAPGISSGLGGLAYAGIPLTHRSTNSAVTFITGHSVTGDVPDNVDWAGLAKSSPALVIFMAIKHLDLIVCIVNFVIQAYLGWVLIKYYCELKEQRSAHEAGDEPVSARNLSSAAAGANQMSRAQYMAHMNQVHQAQMMGQYGHMPHQMGYGQLPQQAPQPQVQTHKQQLAQAAQLAHQQQRMAYKEEQMAQSGGNMGFTPQQMSGYAPQMGQAQYMHRGGY